MSALNGSLTDHDNAERTTVLRDAIKQYIGLQAAMWKALRSHVALGPAHAQIEALCDKQGAVIVAWFDEAIAEANHLMRHTRGLSDDAILHLLNNRDKPAQAVAVTSPPPPATSAAVSVFGAASAAAVDPVMEPVVAKLKELKARGLSDAAILSLLNNGDEPAPPPPTETATPSAPSDPAPSATDAPTTP